MARTIYEKTIRLLIKDMIKDIGLKPGEVITASQVVNWFTERYPKLKSSSIKAHLVMMSTNDKNRLHHPAKPDEDDLFFKVSTGQFRLYEAGKDPAPFTKDPEEGEVLPSDDGADTGKSSEFALERDLQMYLAKNLDRIEPGLTLFEDELCNGLEYPAGRRKIDILAQDKNGAFVVIELKVSRGEDRVLGQILNYVSWVKKNLADPGQKVRGIIIGRRITEDLQLACSYIPEMELMEYELSVTLKTISVGQDASAYAG